MYTAVSRYHVHQGDRIINIIILVIFLLTEGSAINGIIQTASSVINITNPFYQRIYSSHNVFNATLASE